jgi:DNA-binding LytR/AlgR family response regulator
MMKYPVTPDPNNFEEILMLDLDDIVKIEVHDRSVTFHTRTDTYYPLTWTISTLEHHLRAYDFQRLDRNNIVNMKKITHIDEERALVFFDTSITNLSKFATISNREKSRLMKEIEGRIQSNTNNNPTDM